MNKYFIPNLPMYENYYIVKNGEKFEYSCVEEGHRGINFYPLHEMHYLLIPEILKFEFGANILQRKLFKLAVSFE